jgi:hypothetical protein
LKSVTQGKQHASYDARSGEMQRPTYGDEGPLSEAVCSKAAGLRPADYAMREQEAFFYVACKGEGASLRQQRSPIRAFLNRISPRPTIGYVRFNLGIGGDC